MCGGQRGQPVSRRRDPLVARGAANADPAHSRLHLPPVGYLLSQHLPKWDAWSSPSELIHPGDCPSISQRHEQPDRNCRGVDFASASAKIGRELAACSSRRRHGANRQAVNRPSVFRNELRARVPHPRFGYLERGGANGEDGVRRDNDCYSMLLGRIPLGRDVTLRPGLPRTDSRRGMYCQSVTR
jgi:hypothetical protein